MKSLNQKILDAKAELAALEAEAAKRAEEKVFVDVPGFKNLVPRPISDGHKNPFFLKKDGRKWLVYGALPNRIKRMPNLENQFVEGYVYDNHSKSLLKKKD